MNRRLTLLTIMVSVSVSYYLTNWRHLKAEETAEESEFSPSGNYKWMTSMKHDMLKQLVVDVVGALLIHGLGAEIISFDGYDGFVNSVIGGVAVAGVGYLVYYQVTEPHLFNRPPLF